MNEHDVVVGIALPEATGNIEILRLITGTNRWFGLSRYIRHYKQSSVSNCHDFYEISDIDISYSSKWQVRVSLSACALSFTTFSFHVAPCKVAVIANRNPLTDI